MKQELLEYICESKDEDELRAIAEMAWDTLKELRRRLGRVMMASLSPGSEVTWKCKKGGMYVAVVIRKKNTNVLVRITEAPPFARFKPGTQVDVPAQILEGEA